MGKVVLGTTLACVVTAGALGLAGCGSSTATAVPKQTTTTTKYVAPTTTTTTLAVADCLRIVQQAQSGAVVTAAEYRAKCPGAPVDPLALSATTTTTTSPPPPPPPPSKPQKAQKAQKRQKTRRPPPTTRPGATALCNDGTYSYRHNKSVTCSNHRGVQQWL